MKCKSCQKDLLADSYFCNWCNVLVASGNAVRAGIFPRLIASILDGVAIWLLWFVGMMAFGEYGLLVPVAYLIYFLVTLSKGTTPFKKMFGITVVQCQTGQPANIGRMLLREIIGKFVSGLVFSLGYLWAIWDKNSQGWHDKIAQTVVIKGQPAVSTAPVRERVSVGR